MSNASIFVETIDKNHTPPQDPPQDPIFHLPTEKKSSRASNTTEEKIEILQLSEITLGLLLHLLLFLMIINQRKIRRTKSCKLFLNLQLVHVLLLISTLINESYGDYSRIHIYVNNGLLIQSFLGMLLTTIDRLIAIRLPCVYVNLRTKNVYYGIVCSWLPGIMFTVVAIVLSIQQKYMTILSTALLSFSMLVLLSSNACVYAIARRQWNSIRKHCTQASFRGLKQNKRLKSITTCLSIVISFFVLWMPYLVHSLVLLFSGYDSIDKTFTMLVDLVALANSLMDPILFSVFRKDMRKEIRRLLKLSSKRR